MRNWRAGLVVSALSISAQAVTQADLSAVQGDRSRSYFGEGRRVLIGILDGGIDANHPAIRGSVYASQDFSGSHTTDDDPTGQGHATGIAGLYVGHATDYKGLVPKSGIINARVITSKDYTNDTMSGQGLFWALGQGARVINMSYGNNLGEGPLTSKFNLMVDYASELYGASIVTAPGNDNESAVQQVPSGAYNAYGVAALAPAKYNQVSDFSNYALASDRRSKPDIAAPGENVQRANANWETGSYYSLGSGTSFSTPIAGGVLAQMTGFGLAANLPTDPRLLKSILMVSADKEYDTDGTPWTPRHQFTNKTSGVLIVDQPLDDEQGTGRLNAMSAYRVFSKTTDASNAKTNWAYTSLKRYQSMAIDLGHLTAGQRVDGAMNWDYHVGRTDNGNGIIDPGDKFYENVPLADFALSLIKDGKVIASSDSKYDNLEELAYKITSAGNYALEVYRYKYGGNRNESFAVAARVLNNAPNLTPLFASGVQRSIDEVGGVQRSIETAAAPEPSTGAVVALAGAAFCVRRRRNGR